MSELEVDPIAEARAALAVTPPALICARRALEAARRDVAQLGAAVAAMPAERRPPYAADVEAIATEIYWLDQRLTGLEHGAPGVDTRSAAALPPPPRNLPPEEAVRPTRDTGTRRLGPAKGGRR